MVPEAQHFVSLLSPYIHAYGYWVAFFGIMLENAGIPIPAETTLVILSFFASQGALNIRLVIPIAILGDTVGDNIGFFIGRTGGRRLMEKFGPYVRLDIGKLDAMEALFREKGARTVFTAHFFSTTRFIAAFAAGVSHMPYRKFLAVNVAAAVVFVTLVTGISYYFGSNLDATLRIFHLFRIAGLTVAVLLVTAYLYRFYLRKRHLYGRLGLKIISLAIAASVVFGFAFYAISGALIVLPYTGKYAGAPNGIADGIEVNVEQGFISDIEGRNIIITALGEPAVTLSGTGVVNLTIRNIKTDETAVRVSKGRTARPIALDGLTFNLTVDVREKAVVRLTPERESRKKFVWAAAGDTRDWGPVFGSLVDSINGRNPAFVIHAGDFVKEGDRRNYRAFLTAVSDMSIPLYTCPGPREVSDNGATAYGKTFGPMNYSFTYLNSAFIVLDTAAPMDKTEFGWLTAELEKSKGRNIFIVTYRAPVDNADFTGLLSSYGVKAVYSVKESGAIGPATGKVRYFFLERTSGKGYFYILTRVNGKEVYFEKVGVIPKGLTTVDRIILAYEDLKRRLVRFIE